MKILKLNFLSSGIFRVSSLLIIGFLIINPSGVLADSFTQNDANSIISETPFYDPAQTCSNGSTSAQSLGSGTNVYILGDSITDRTESAYKSSFSAKSITTTIDGSDSRSLDVPGKTGNKLNGIDTIGKDKSSIQQANAIVVALGTNGGDTNSSIDKAISLIRADNSTAPIYWVDTIVVNRPTYDSTIQQANQAIYSQASSQNYTVIPWSTTVDPGASPKNIKGDMADPNGFIDPNPLSGLGVHPSIPNGVNALANLVVNAVTTGSVSSGNSSNNPTSCCNGSGGSNLTSPAPSSGTLTISYGQLSVTVYLPGDGKPHPLVLFAPGENQTSHNGFYDSYLKRTAKQGFVVAGINFRNNSSPGDIASEVQDINTLVQKLPNDPQLSGLLSGSIGLIGHSDGGIDAVEAGYGVNQVKGLSAIIEEDGATPFSGTNLPLGLPNSGPPLLLMHGTADQIQPISTGSDAVWSAVNASYKGYAKFLGADHFSYITGNSDNINENPPVNFSSDNAAVDALTGAFLNRFLNGQNDSSTSLANVVSQYSNKISFEEKGSDTPNPVQPLSSTPTSNVGVCCASTLSGNGNGIEAYNYFISKGLSPGGAAGIVGNMTEESTGVDPERLQSHFQGEQPAESLSQSVINDNVVGWGIVQWTPPSKVITASEKNGTPDSTIDTLSFQLNFLYNELQQSYATVLSKLDHDATAQAGADDFYQGFEQPGETLSFGYAHADLHNRESYSQAYFALATNNIPLPANIAVSHNSGGSGSSTSTASSGSSCASNSGYQNPFHDMTNLGQSRIDEGVDYYAKPGTTVPVYAIGNGTVTLATDKSGFYTTSHGFADWIVYQLSDGPAAGKFIYIAEACPPVVKTGQSVTSDTLLCNIQPDSIETGWAMNATAQAAAAYYSYLHHEGYETAYGVNFNQLLVSLGAPPGHLDTTSDPGGTVVGTLPSGWPSWKQGN